jgi:hypothetical protein
MLAKSVTLIQQTCTETGRDLGAMKRSIKNFWRLVKTFLFDRVRN